MNPSPLPKVGLGMRRSAIGEARHDDRQLKSDGFFDMNGVVWSGDFASRNGVVGSDVDILAATSRTYFGVQFYIEDLLGRPVDLVTEKALRPEFRPYVEQEAVMYPLKQSESFKISRSRHPSPGSRPLRLHTQRSNGKLTPIHRAFLPMPKCIATD